MIKFTYTILYVQNVEKSIHFYENGLGLKRKFIHPENLYGELITGETILAFASIETASSNLKDGFVQSKVSEKPFGIEIGFTTQKVEETIQNAIKHGAILVEEPKTKPWGQIVGYVRDIDGFLIEICSPME